MTFKAAYVRQTLDHQVIAPSVFGFAALALTPFFIKEKNKASKALALLSLSSMLFVAIPANMPMKGIPAVLIYPAMLFSNLYDTAVRLPQCAMVLQGQSSGEADYLKRMAVIKEKNHLPTLDGTVDLLPAEINVVIANNYNYQPRPVIQSYLAYKESLLETNKNYWPQKKAADYVILQEMKDTYGYYPALHDGPSWLELLSRYQPSWCEATALIIKKTATAGTMKLVPLQTIEAKMGDPIKIESSTKILYAKINTKITALGSLQKLFFRIYPANITVKMKNGKSESYVAPTDNLRAGFILSPYFSQPQEMKELYSGPDAERSVVELNIWPRANDLPWPVHSDSYTIELFALEGQN